MERWAKKQHHMIRPQVFLAMLLCGCDVSSNGLLVAKKDMAFVMKSMLITFVASTSFFVAVRRQGWGLQGVWW